MTRQALSDIKVLELSDFISGPYCGKLLANTGAQVIKVENPGLGDKARSWGLSRKTNPTRRKAGSSCF